MKKLQSVMAVVLAVVMLFALVGCDKFPSIQKAFEKEGYTLDNNSITAAVINTAVNATKSYYEEKGLEVPFVTSVFKKGLSVGVVFEFKNQKAMKEFYDEQSETFKGFVKDMSESEFMNGNCIMFSLSSDMYTIFKNA